MKEMFENSVVVIGQITKGDKTGTIKRQAANISKICPTIFIAEDTTIFVGESILDQAHTEKDGEK